MRPSFAKKVHRNWRNREEDWGTWQMPTCRVCVPRMSHSWIAWGHNWETESHNYRHTMPGYNRRLRDREQRQHGYSNRLQERKRRKVRTVLLLKVWHASLIFQHPFKHPVGRSKCSVELDRHIHPSPLYNDKDSVLRGVYHSYSLHQKPSCACSVHCYSHAGRCPMCGCDSTL